MPRSLKIKLISPKMSLRPMDSEFKRRMSPSLSLVTVASMTPKPHMVYIEDENIRHIDYNNDPDLVGITVNVDTTYRSFEIARQYRSRGIKVIFGGIHASSCPDLMLKYCDSVCIGEADGLWTAIINDLLNDRLQKKYYYEGSTSSSATIIPDWSLISSKSYLYNNIISASRGCPFKCEFCYNSCDYIKSGFRNRPFQHVLDEIENLNSRQVMFIDDNLIGNVNWTQQFVEQLNPLNIIWHAATSTNLVHYPRLIERMAVSGCRSLFIGFESVNAASIESAQKFQNKISEYETLIKTLHDHGIMVNASLTFGFDHDSHDVFERTLEWLVDNRIETMTAHILTPYPGTKLYKRLLEEKRICDFNLSKYNTANVVFHPRNMTRQELYDGYIKIYRDFYSFRNIYRRRPASNKLIAPYFMFNFGYRKFGRATSLIGRMGLMKQVGRLGRKLAYGID
jgi:radical SAM superfamily enzyme YgiQ (UPF0313 family)